MEIRAARLVAHDRPLVVETLELPPPGDGEVVVDMAFGGVNPVDRYQAIGRVATGASLPRTLGSEGAGSVGERAVFVPGGSVRGGGLWATKVLAREPDLVDVPDGVSLEVAASMGVAGVTAWRCVTEVGEVAPDDRVLVLGATGGVGHIAVSVAKGLGAEVRGHTGSAAKAAWVRARGADEVVVADAAGLASALDGWKPTVVIDPLGGAFTGAAIAALDTRGRLVLYGTSAGPEGEVPLQQLYRKALSIRGYGGLIETAERLALGIREGLDAVRNHKMEIVIGDVVPLDDVNASFERIVERRVTGKQVLDLS